MRRLLCLGPCALLAAPAIADAQDGSGEGSQAIFLADIDPSAIRPGQPPGHFMSIRWEKGALPTR
jgi:hypothetical protein